MPFINIKMTPGATPEKKAELIKKMTQLMVDLLAKNPETTHVVIEEVPAENWGVAGETVASRRKRGA
jgi:4-oxalocrotonate tautomerase